MGVAPMIRRTLLTLLALVLLVGITACGGGDDDSGDSSSDGDAATDEPSAGDTEPDSGDATTTPDAGDGASAEEDVADQLGVDREFTGEGSEAFCAEVNTMRENGLDAAGVDDGAFADAMMAITPPAEIATEWTNLFTVQKALAADPSGNAMAEMSEEEVAEWSSAGSVVAAYLADVCHLDDSGG